MLLRSGLTPRPLLQREVVRQLSFRCPVPLASELRRKAAFNQLEQQQIIVEGIKRVMAELPDPPEGWRGSDAIQAGSSFQRGRHARHCGGCATTARRMLPSRT